MCGMNMVGLQMSAVTKGPVMSSFWITQPSVSAVLHEAPALLCIFLLHQIFCLSAADLSSRLEASSITPKYNNFHSPVYLATLWEPCSMLSSPLWCYLSFSIASTSSQKHWREANVISLELCDAQKKAEWIKATWNSGGKSRPEQHGVENTHTHIHTTGDTNYAI